MNCSFHRILASLLLIFFAAPALAANEPTILSAILDGENVLVRVSVPAGAVRVTLEGKNRAIGSSWQPRAVQRIPDPALASEITFLLRRSENLEILRARADDTDLPAAFFTGASEFAGTVTTNNNVPPLDPGGPETNGPGRDAATVEESDIWKIAGDTLYFFNAYRGLQVIDIANPAAPSLRGTFPMSAAGEQMYVLASGHAVLLTAASCVNGNQSQVLIIDTAPAAPAKVGDVSLEGWIIESRLVGSVLYVLSQTYRQIPADNGGVTYEYGQLLNSIDLSAPAAPALKGSLFMPGSSAAVYATDRFFFVANQPDWINSNVRVVDISAGNGSMEIAATIALAGTVRDKFKMNLDGDIFTVITAAWDPNRRWITRLSNYSLIDPNAPQLVGGLQLAEGEQLFATRFDGNRAYIVTYLVIDPLWIIDLSNPASPTISGELHVPGWSTYIHPMGDRLLAMGIDDTDGRRVAVSLFNVSNPAAPALLDKVIMGENYSWSEANSDEKALAVLPEAGLILVPWQGYTTGGYANRVQLIDFDRDTLTARGQITDQLAPRRATLRAEHVLSLSGNELLSLNAANRDAPVLASRLQLAWNADRVFVVGDHTLQLDSGGAALRVTARSNLDRAVNTVRLDTTRSISGSAIRDGKLYLAHPPRFDNPWAVFPGPVAEATADPQTLKVSIWDISNLPSVTLLGEATATTDNQWWGTLTPLWPRDGLLVWSGGGNNYWWWWGGPMIDIAFPGFRWYGSGGGTYIAFDVSNSAEPAFKSIVNLTDNSWSHTTGVVASGLIYASRQANEFVEGFLVTEPRETANADGTTDPAPTGSWVTRYFLDVIDFGDAASPVVRRPVNIPGALQGVSHNGSILYTAGYLYNERGETDWRQRLQASAYDGVAAFQLDSVLLTGSGNVIVDGANLFVDSQLAENAITLDRYQLSPEGRLTRLSRMPRPSWTQRLRFIGDLAVISSQSKIELFDASDRGAWRAIGDAPLPCYNYIEINTGDGSLSGGFWYANGQFGASHIPLAQ